MPRKQGCGNEVESVQVNDNGARMVRRKSPRSIGAKKASKPAVRAKAQFRKTGKKTRSGSGSSDATRKSSSGARRAGLEPNVQVPISDLRAMAGTLRRWIIERSLASNVGHIGSALSIVEIITALWGGVMRRPGTSAPDRDRFILSKGHAALALYCAMKYKGLLDEETFASFCGDGTLLGQHPECALPGVELSTGSLGQGLSVGCGLAVGLKWSGSNARVFVLLSDAECNEGQVWEAAQFAAHHRLSSLTALVDLNGMQALGRTKGILDLTPLGEKWKAFGWDTTELDGHDVGALRKSLAAPVRGGRPRCLVARTVLGKGVSFMEDRLEWHYRNLTPDLAEKALRELGVDS